MKTYIILWHLIDKMAKKSSLVPNRRGVGIIGGEGGWKNLQNLISRGGGWRIFLNLKDFFIFKQDYFEFHV